MQSPNPNPTNKSTSTTNKSPSPPPSNHGSPNETSPLSKSSEESMEKKTLETVLEVLEELKMSKNKMGCGDSKAMVSDDSTVVMGEGVNGGQARNSSPILICPKCRKEFFTRNSTIDHIKKYPDCDPIGASNPSQSDYPIGPPDSDLIGPSNPTQPDHPIGPPDCDPIGPSNPTQPDHPIGPSNPTQPDLNKGVGLDLNEAQPMEIEGSSIAAPEHVERKGYGFDLNELPPPDEEDDDSMIM